MRVVKPFLSCPLDPERFVVCTGAKGLPDALDRTLDRAIAACREGRCVLSIVPMQLLLESTFLGCICRTNDRLAQRQIMAIKALGKASSIAAAGDERFAELGADAIKLIDLETLKSEGSGGGVAP